MNRNNTGLVARAVALAFVLAFGAAPSRTAQPTVVAVQVDKPGAAIPSTLFGLFFEDINFGADGGLYPERVKNRSFEFPDPLMAWKQIQRARSNGTLTVLTQDPLNEENSHYLHFDVKAGGKGFGVANEGFRGM